MTDLVALVQKSMAKCFQKTEGDVNSPEMAIAAVRGVIKWLQEDVEFADSYSGPELMETKHLRHVLGVLQEQVRK